MSLFLISKIEDWEEPFLLTDRHRSGWPRNIIFDILIQACILAGKIAGNKPSPQEEDILDNAPFCIFISAIDILRKSKSLFFKIINFRFQSIQLITSANCNSTWSLDLAWNHRMKRIPIAPSHRALLPQPRIPHTMCIDKKFDTLCCRSFQFLHHLGRRWRFVTQDWVFDQEFVLCWEGLCVQGVHLSTGCYCEPHYLVWVQQTFWWVRLECWNVRWFYLDHPGCTLKAMYLLECGFFNVMSPLSLKSESEKGWKTISAPDKTSNMKTCIIKNMVSSNYKV